MQRTTGRDDPYYRVAAVALVAGAVIAIVFNGLFPRAEDPWDTTGVLTMMMENQVLRQVSFLGATAAILALTTGVVGIHRSLEGGTGAVWGRLGLYSVLVGTALFVAAAALGMAATGVAVEWARSGSGLTGPEFAVAAALNAADDHIWFLSIVTYWGGLGLVGTGMVKDGLYPRWLGGVILVVGFAAAIVVGAPLAYGVEAPALFLIFAILAMLSALWALVTGVWILRKAPEPHR